MTVLHNKKLLAVALAAISFVAVPTTAVLAASSTAVVNMRRLTEEEYRASIADIFGKDIEVRGVFEPTIRVGGLLAASTTILSVTPAGFDSFSKMADSIAVQVTDQKHRAKLISCAPKDPKAADDACAGQTLSHYGLMLFRRPLTDAELKGRIALSAKMANSSKDFYTGLRYGLATLLQSSDFIFRNEIAVPVAGSKDYTLEPYSRASRLSYLMWGTTPDAELLKSAETGDLATPAGLDKQVNRLMASPRLEAGLRAFFTDMLELDTFDTVSKDSLIYPKWGVVMATSAKEETLRTVMDVALRQNGDIRDLMTTRKTFINRNLAAIYGIPFNFNDEWVAHEFPASSGRSGIVTQVAMLSMFSHPGRSSPTKRGVALMDIFLCEPTPLPPNNVDFSAVNDTNGPLKTVRERLMAHATNPTCASCHTHSDPMGLSLEGFDTIGGRRLKENGALIDLTASIKGKSFSDGAGVGNYLHDNAKYPACVARKLYSYSKGLNSEDVDNSAFKAAYKSFTDSGYRMKTLLKDMVEGPNFFSTPAPVVEASNSSSVKLANK